MGLQQLALSTGSGDRGLSGGSRLPSSGSARPASGGERSQAAHRRGGRGWSQGQARAEWGRWRRRRQPLGRAGAVVDDGGDDAESDATPPSSDSPALSLRQRPHRPPSLRLPGQLAPSAREMMLGGVGGVKGWGGSLGSSSPSAEGGVASPRGRAL